MLLRFRFLLRHPLRLFDLRRPRIRQLDCIQLVFDNKCLLLVGWDAVPATGVRIRPGHTRFHSSSGAAICKLPTGTTAVDILVQNVWRSQKKQLFLQQLTVNEAVFNYFDKNYTDGIQLAAGISNPGFKIPDVQPAYISVTIPTTIQSSSYSLSFHLHPFNDYAP